MKSSKAARRKRTARKTKPARKAMRIHVAGRVTSFFKGKNSVWKVGLGRAWSALGKTAR